MYYFYSGHQIQLAAVKIHSIFKIFVIEANGNGNGPMYNIVICTTIKAGLTEIMIVALFMMPLKLNRIFFLLPQIAKNT